MSWVHYDEMSRCSTGSGFFKKDLYLAYFQTKTISQLSFIQESACEAVLSLIMLVIAAVYKTKLKHMLYKQTWGENILALLKYWWSRFCWSNIIPSVIIPNRRNPEERQLSLHNHSTTLKGVGNGTSSLRASSSGEAWVRERLQVQSGCPLPASKVPCSTNLSTHSSSFAKNVLTFNTWIGWDIFTWSLTDSHMSHVRVFQNFCGKYN